MEKINLEPIYKRITGFDRFFSDIENIANGPQTYTYPPYNIRKSNEDETYVIDIAVAGFNLDEIEIIRDKNTLSVSGSKTKNDDVKYIHKGIATRNFVRKFALSDFVEVIGATMENGMLSIDLKRIVPEKYQPKKININVPIPNEKWYYLQFSNPVG